MSRTTLRAPLAVLGVGMAFAASLVVAPAAQAAPADGALSIISSAARLPSGGTLTLSGQLTSGGFPRAGVPVLLLARTGGTPVDAVARTLTTDVNGQVSTAFHPRLSTTYTFAFAGDDTTSAIRSASTVNQILPGVVTAANRRTASQGDPVVLKGYLRPALAGAPITLERRVGSGAAWTVQVRTRANAAAAYQFSFAAPLAGTLGFRVGLPGAPSYLPAYGPVQTLYVAAPLAVGAKGPLVLALQNRLKALHYDMGAADSTFGSETLHALVAFQKGQGLPRTGKYDVATRERLAAPRALRLRYPAAGRAVEIDLSKQILMMSQDGVITRIVDVSTGTNTYYRSDGVRYLAFTPLGRFHIYRKIDGIRVARLGELYRPSYFLQGWAIHGSSSVPIYPASHGCVRVTNASINRIYSLLTVGTPVAIYTR